MRQDAHSFREERRDLPAPSRRSPAPLPLPRAGPPNLLKGRHAVTAPTKQQSIIYQVSMYSALVDIQKGPNLEADLYADIQAALKNAEADIGRWSVAWGPIVVPFDTTSYALNAMYVAQSEDQPGTYVVGIAGTNPDSLADWLLEDGLVSVQLPWIYGLFEAPDARISLATGIGLVILQNATPGTGIPGSGTTLLQFVQGLGGKKGTNLIVSGHSLAGALSPTLTLWLQDIRILWDPFSAVTLSTMPTAGPTAGNAAFAAYSNSRISATRFANAIDVVPHAWQASDLAEIPTLYAPNIEPDATINDLVAGAQKLSANGDYTQIVNDTGWFPFQVNKAIIHEFAPPLVNFSLQLAWQHTTAYLRYFGVKSSELEGWAGRFQTSFAAAASAAGTATGAARTVTAPVGGTPTVIPSGSDPGSADIAGQVLADLRRAGTPEQQQQVSIPVDPQRLANSPAGTAG